ncbi:hypothetical protein Clacol_007284 [Clathrus columnatus]|uniref:Thaumatin-like protein n=1 Tax=Clathrus columnatus TaxID=1419009 RepID=A0AAV5AFH8_9AGAM|nr:hypothetical protein Clacol_007284 [Clathrus columnatus]
MAALLPSGNLPSCDPRSLLGGLECDPHTGTGVPPASLAEWTLGVNGAPDYYDVSLVDGYNLPLRIDNNVGCPVADCPVDLGPNCPAPLKGPFDSTGFPVGCRSACQANLDGDPCKREKVLANRLTGHPLANSANCCTGSHNTPATCPPSGVAGQHFGHVLRPCKQITRSPSVPRDYLFFKLKGCYWVEIATWRAGIWICRQYQHRLAKSHVLNQVISWLFMTCYMINFEQEWPPASHGTGEGTQKTASNVSTVSNRPSNRSRVYTDPSSPSRPSGPTGWMAPSGSSRTLQVPDNWTSGRMWGRTGCDNEGNCESGSCIGGIECDPNVGTGDAPASLAEWSLSAGPVDFYDVSLVDGYNLPMSITNNAGCSIADCAADLLPSCPAQLAATTGDGTIVGCKSSCDLTSGLSNSPDCCTGSHSTPQTCPPTGVQNKCRNSYVYAYDESSGTALWACDVSKKADYTLTFCPQNLINIVRDGDGLPPINSSMVVTPSVSPSETPASAPLSTNSNSSPTITPASISSPVQGKQTASSLKSCRAKWRELVNIKNTSGPTHRHRIFRRHI